MKSKDEALFNTQQSAGSTDKLDYSKGEELVRNIVIPRSQFGAKWIKDEGYAIGIENIKISENYKTLEEALNTIGYGVDKDDDGEEILVKTGEVDYELIVRVMKALMIIEDIKKGDQENG